MSKTKQFTLLATSSPIAVHNRHFGVRVISTHHKFHSIGEITSQAARRLAVELCAAADDADRNTKQFCDDVRRRRR